MAPRTKTMGVVGLLGCALSAGAATNDVGAATSTASTRAPAVEWPRGMFDWPALNAQAKADMLQPIRPGEPGKTPFWHGGLRACIYAPSFDLPETNGATCYRFTVKSVSPVVATIKVQDPVAAAAAAAARAAAEAKAKAEKPPAEPSAQEAASDAPGLDEKPAPKPRVAAQPFTPSFALAEVWDKVPVGEYEVTITGWGASGSRKGAVQQAFHQRRTAEESAPVLQGSAAPGAVQYACEIRHLGKPLVFEAGRPWAPLSPVWDEVPEGDAVLTVEAIDKAGGTAVGTSGVRRFSRELPFEGPGLEALLTYADAVRTSLVWQLQRPYCAQFSVDRETYDLGKYPSKLTGLGTVHIGVLYAGLKPRPADADRALDMSRRAARALIAASTPASAALPFLPPTYRGEYGFKPDHIMMLYPALAAWIYLDLHDLTREDEFLQAALRIAETYRKTQLADGSWPSIMAASTGKVVSDVPLVLTDEPTMNVLGFCERLVKQYGRQEFQPMHEAAVRWFLAGPVKSFHPQGLFEDGAPSKGNLSGNTAAGMAVYLLTHARGPEDVATAEDLLRLGEDQFVLWHRAPKGWTLTPCALEQNAYRVPVCCSASFYMDGCLAAYKATGKKLWLAKAVVMANAHVEFVRRIGMIPTLWLYGDSGWPNCPAQSARSLLGFAAAAEGIVTAGK